MLPPLLLLGIVCIVPMLIPVLATCAVCMDYDHHHRLLHPTSYCSKEAFFARMSLSKLILEELCFACQSETRGREPSTAFLLVACQALSAC